MKPTGIEVETKKNELVYNGLQPICVRVKTWYMIHGHPSHN